MVIGAKNFGDPQKKIIVVLSSTAEEVESIQIQQPLSYTHKFINLLYLSNFKNLFLVSC